MPFGLVVCILIILFWAFKIYFLCFLFEYFSSVFSLGNL